MNFIDYSQVFQNKIKVFLTQVDNYWDSGYPSTRINKINNCFNLNGRLIIAPKQIHSNKVSVLTNQLTISPECDAIIYQSSSKIVGTISVADCIPICLYDSKSEYIALVHSGWRGTDKKIILKTISELERLGVNKNNLKIFLGPSIKGCCYEVSKKIATRFDSPSILARDGKYFVDLPNQVKFDLESMCIPSKNIVLNNLCTYEDNKCHSFRRDKESSGRMTLIAYREDIR